MKKFLNIIGICLVLSAYAQQGTFILNNYSAYNFNGAIVAGNPTPTGGTCYPLVSSNNPNPLVVPADSHIGNGLALQIDNYRDQYTASLYPIATWEVSTSATNQGVLRTWSHPAVMPGGAVSNNTKWGGSKFYMTDPATGAQVPLFNANIAVAGTCNTTVPDYYTCPSGSAEIFTINSGTNTITYLNIY